MRTPVRFLLCISVFFAWSLTAIAGDCGHDPTLILPGKCVGKIVSSTRFSDLKKLLPGHTIARGMSSSEVGYECGTFIDPDMPTQIYVQWTDPTEPAEDVSNLEEGRQRCRTIDFANDKIESIDFPGGGTVLTPDGHEHDAIGGKGAPWHTVEGIRIGTPFQTMRKLLPKGFTISGWGWDYGGRAHLVDDLWADMIYDEAARQRLTHVEMDSLMGDQSIEITNDSLNKLDPIIGSFLISFRNGKAK